MSVSLLVFSVLFVIVAMVTKIIGCGAMAKICRFKNNEALNSQRGRTFTVKAKLSDLFDAFGEERLKTFVQEKTAAASQNPDYERTTENIVGNWIMLGIFAFVFVLLSTIVLELIDKDKR